MTLTPEQMEILYSFTKKKFVPWYDLQVELVDHLAERIAEEMQKDQTLDFNRALNRVYAGFGIYGFAEIVRERLSLLQKEANRQMWLEVKNQFNFKNLLRSVAIFAVIIFSALHIDLIFVASASIILLFTDLVFFRKFHSFRMHLRNKKKLMVTQHLPLLGMGSFIYLQVLGMRYFELFTEQQAHSDKYRIYFSVLLFIGVIGYLAARQVTENLYSKAKKEYPEAFA